MKGTEKQIRWATDIITEARETIRRNIEKTEGNADEIKEHKIWKWLENEYESTMKQIPNEASFIIDNRRKLNSDAVIYLYNQASMGHIKIEK